MGEARGHELMRALGGLTEGDAVDISAEYSYLAVHIVHI
jgi:hypothetical protein